MSVAERFWSKVEKTESCWIWTGSKPNGYGQFYLEGKNRPAHRVSYELLRGAIPNGLVLDHLCQTPACVNPDHLEPVTHQENIRRGPRERYGANRYKTHCSRGHLLSGDNVLLQGSRRRCRECRLARERTKARLANVRAELDAERKIKAELYEHLEWLLTSYDLGVVGAERTEKLLARARGEEVAL